MHVDSLSSPRILSLLSRIRSGSLLVAVLLVGVGAYAVYETNAHGNGQNINNLTQKYTNAGCSCHCSSNTSSTTVTLSTGSGSSPLAAIPNTAYTFTVTVANSGESYGGVEVA